MKTKPEITNVYLWQNGMVMVFDQFGKQMPDYQGEVSRVKSAIRKDAPETAVYHGGDWRGEKVWEVAPL